MDLKETNTEKAILQAAIIEFADKGFSGSRTTEIAQRAGVTHAMLHYYFRTKELLFDKVINNKIEDFCSAILPVFTDKALPLTDRIIKGATMHFEFLKDNPKLPSLLIGIYTSGSDVADKVTSLMQSGIRPAILSLQKDLDSAYIRNEVAKIDAVMLVADIVSLNVMPFILWPIASNILGLDETSKEFFLQQKKEENITTILKRLQPCN